VYVLLGSHCSGSDITTSAKLLNSVLLVIDSIRFGKNLPLLSLLGASVLIPDLPMNLPYLSLSIFILMSRVLVI